MPLISPSLLHPESYLAQSPFNLSLPSIDVPEMPSLPNMDSVRDIFLALYQATVGFLVELLAHAEQFAKEHPEEVKLGGIVLLAVVALIVLWFALQALSSVLAAVGTGLASIGTAAMKGLSLVFHPIRHVFLYAAAGIFNLAGFTADGIAAGSTAASVQSVVYGAFTKGIFSLFQSLGVILGRLVSPAA